MLDLNYTRKMLLFDTSLVTGFKAEHIHFGINYSKEFKEN